MLLIDYRIQFFSLIFPFFQGKDSEGKQKVYEQVPRVFVSFKDPFAYELRAYIYQARAMYGSDRNGLSGTYVCIICMRNGSMGSECMEEDCVAFSVHLYIYVYTILMQNVHIIVHTHKYVGTDSVFFKLYYSCMKMDA